MNIGISTFHFAPNSGAMLQCYALQKTIESMGHQVTIINYRPEYHTDRYSPFRNPFKYSNDLISFAKNVFYNRNAFKRYTRNKCFAKFEKYFNQSQVFTSLDQWKKLNVNLDAIVCGSDQIWNKTLTNNSFDGAYFAAFPGYSGKKIAYAASVGETNIEDNLIELNRLLSDFSAISMREHISSKKMESVLNKHVSTVPDPTLLLDSSEYEELFVKLDLPKHYLLVYFFGNNELLPKVINEYEKRYHIPIISISPYKNQINYKYRWISDLGPAEFLSYIYGSDAVITNSFHCSVFSTIFKKKLVVIKNRSRNERLVNLFNSLDANNLIVGNESDILPSIENLNNCSDLSEKIKLQKKIGRNFLEKNLGVTI